jgi:enamine deaminase RidA (YjgF/YER057c/UK114 family)
LAERSEADVTGYHFSPRLHQSTAPFSKFVQHGDFQAINSVYAQRLHAPFPARTTIQVAALPLGAKVQIDAIITMAKPRKVES